MYKCLQYIKSEVDIRGLRDAYVVDHVTAAGSVAPAVLVLILVHVVRNDVDDVIISSSSTRTRNP